MRARTWESVLPLQSSSSLILASISREGDSPLVVALFFILFAPHSALFLSCEGTNHQSGRHSLHDDSLRLAAIRVSACDRESVCNLVDYGLELNASLLDKRCPRRAAAQTGSNAARIRPPRSQFVSFQSVSHGSRHRRAARARDPDRPCRRAS